MKRSIAYLALLDPTHASVTLKLSHMGFSQYTMRFTKIEASFDYDPVKPETSAISVRIDPASLETGDSKFNAELTGDGWLEAGKYPDIKFVSTGVDVGDGTHGTVTGNLTFHGVTKPVTLNVTFNGVGAGMNPMAVKTGFSGTAMIKRSDFGVSKYVPLVGDDVTVLIETEFDRK